VYLPYVCAGAGLQRWRAVLVVFGTSVCMRRTGNGQIEKKPDRSAALSFTALMKLVA